MLKNCCEHHAGRMEPTDGNQGSLERRRQQLSFVQINNKHNILWQRGYEISFFYASRWNKLKISLFVYIFHLSEKHYCYAVVSMTLTLVCLPAHFNKHNVTLIKLGTNVAKVTTPWRYCLPSFIAFGCFGLKNNVWCKMEINFTREHRK